MDMMFKDPYKWIIMQFCKTPKFSRGSADRIKSDEQNHSAYQNPNGCCRMLKKGRKL